MSEEDQPSVNERLKKLRESTSSSTNDNANTSSSFLSKLKKPLKKIMPFGIVGAIIATGLIGYLSSDYLTKRQNYPERNVLYRSSNITSLAGNSGNRIQSRSDRDSITKFYEGGGIESKVGTFLFETTREIRGDIEYFNLDNSQKMRVVSSTQKPEKFQAGLRLKGSLNFREQFAEIVLASKTKSLRKYTVYKITPERGFINRDIDIFEYEDGSRKMINQLIESRNLLGWFFGKEYRAGTGLEYFLASPENESYEQSFLEHLRILDSVQSSNPKRREEIVEKLIKIQDEMHKKTVYATFEDGFFKFLPQESTIYLGDNPTSLERLSNFIGFGRKNHDILRVENNWDLWPGSIPLLTNFYFGSGENKIYPFDKYNNGGYTVKDKFGKLAQIEINDFILYYGQDVLYNYFLDINGDGKINKEQELIGSVLCRTTHDERMEITRLANGDRPDVDTTFTVNYSFMSPTENKDLSKDYFKLCAYLETLIPDQLHRGFGKHSLLGLINDQRSDIMLFDDLSVENMSRSLTQESTLSAEKDIINLLIATKRPYAENLAQEFGVGDNFKGKYESSDKLKEKLYLGFVPYALGLPLLLTSGYYIRRKHVSKKK